MNYADRFARKAFTANAKLRRQAAADRVVSRRLLSQRLLNRVLAFFMSKKEPPEDPYAYSLVRVKPRLPQLSRGATAELDN